MIEFIKSKNNRTEKWTIPNNENDCDTRYIGQTNSHQLQCMNEFKHTALIQKILKSFKKKKH